MNAKRGKNFTLRKRGEEQNKTQIQKGTEKDKMNPNESQWTCHRAWEILDLNSGTGKDRPGQTSQHNQQDHASNETTAA